MKKTKRLHRLLKHHHVNVDEVKNNERKQEIIKYIEKENPSIKELSQREKSSYIKTYFKEKEVARRIKLQEHLEVFNDAVLAIVITIIVLNLPMPKNISLASMSSLLETIGIYFVSFIVVANFWLTHHFIFEKIKTGISESLVVLDFLFMAELSLLPFLTKWMVENHSYLPVVIYGGVYLLATVTLIFISMRINQRVKYYYPKLYHQLNKIEWYRLAIIVPINLLLMFGAYFFPRAIFIMYVIMPVISFLSYIFADDEERRFEDHMEVIQQEDNQPLSEELAQNMAEHISEKIEEQMTEAIEDKIEEQMTETIEEQMNEVIEDKINELKK